MSIFASDVGRGFDQFCGSWYLHNKWDIRCYVWDRLKDKHDLMSGALVNTKIQFIFLLSLWEEKPVLFSYRSVYNIFDIILNSFTSFALLPWQELISLIGEVYFNIGTTFVLATVKIRKNDYTSLLDVRPLFWNFVLNNSWSVNFAIFHTLSVLFLYFYLHISQYFATY